VDEDIQIQRHPFFVSLQLHHKYVINLLLFFLNLCVPAASEEDISKNNKITKQRRQFNVILRASHDQAKDLTKPRGK